LTVHHQSSNIDDVKWFCTEEPCKIVYVKTSSNFQPTLIIDFLAQLNGYNDRYFCRRVRCVLGVRCVDWKPRLTLEVRYSKFVTQQSLAKQKITW